MSSSNLQIINSDCVVIGGGLTGLIIATILQRRGIKVTVLDKAAEVGGRLATRHIIQDEAIQGAFDYGIQYFKVNNPEFQVWVDRWLKDNAIKEWGKGFDGVDSQPCYCGVNGMGKFAKYLAQDLDIHTNTEVTEFSYEKKWSIQTQENRQYQGDMLIMTSPIPQSLSLLDASLIPFPLEVRFALEQIVYDSCITVIALIEKPSNIPSPGVISLEGNSIALLVDNHQKGFSPNGHAITIHATPEFSEYYWDSDDAEIVYKLMTAAADYLNSPIIKYQIHRWHYSSPRSSYSESYLGLLELPLVMAGDAFVAPTVEGAVMSGVDAANLICQRFGVKC